MITKLGGENRDCCRSIGWAVFALALMVSLPMGARAAVITQTLPEFSGNGSGTVGSFVFTLPSGETIASARIEGTFGNSIVRNSSGVDLSLDFMAVASCVQFASCYFGSTPEPWVLDLLPADLALLADGTADFGFIQTSSGVVRLGQTTLTIETVVQIVSEPPGLALFAIALAGLGFLRGRGGRFPVS